MKNYFPFFEIHILWSGIFEQNYFLLIFEVLNIDDDIKQLIMEGKSSIEIRRVALEKDYKPLIVDGVNKVLNGNTNLSELNKKLLIYNNI